MNVLSNWVREFRALPRLMQIRFVVLGIGGALDIVYHATPAAWTDIISLYLGQDGYYAHLVTLGGMLITLIGLFAAQVDRIRHSSAGR